jgi:acetoacetyl-CoA synthetase
MPGSVRFPGSTLNYTAEVFRGREDGDIAAVGVTETGAPVDVTWRELRRQVASVASALSGLGVRPGDRVVGYLPNSVEAMVAFLATASLGAIWAVCGLDYVGSAAQARFAQLEPTVLVTATRSQHGGRLVDRSDDVAGLRAALPTLAATVIIDNDADPLPGTVSWLSITGGDAERAPVPVPFDHPLWVLFSSGTTGRPKGMVHSHGGVVLEQLKQLAFHHNLGKGDRILWYTTPSWMLWNSLVGALLVGATVVCYDGSPAFRRPDALWELVVRLRVTVLGTSPGYLASCRKAGVRLQDHDLKTLVRLGVTGSPLPAACLGVALESWGPDGKPVRNAVGELVVRRPMPSMPVRFWNDPDGTRYRDAYFGTFPGGGDRDDAAGLGPGVTATGPPSPAAIR